MWNDFKKFISRGNVLDLAVGVIIGGAVGKIVSSLVNDIIMPILGIILGKVDFTSLKYVISPAQGETPELAINYGMFIQNVIDFLIIAFAIFMMIRMIEKFKKKENVVAPPKPSEEVILLTEIRDLLKNEKDAGK
ncbi:large-conductance mechanosensitive channel protein MscL [Vibrio parahaemolyticus]|nr:large-conductance mechanosensitive channel protein MscL [Tissierellales bacterium]MDG2870836.1 large-conductance mechanosensitive channel protein MscL [Vibrio parahaemolyticus]